MFLICLLYVTATLAKTKQKRLRGFSVKARPAEKPAPTQKNPDYGFWEKSQCGATMKGAGFSPEGFARVVAHGVHSMTLTDIKKYFNPEADARNRVAVVNPNLADKRNPILRSAPVGEKELFATSGMNAVDKMLTHMGDKNFGVRAYTDLEKVVHQLHMEELWTHGKKAYEQFAEEVAAKGPGYKQKLCGCVNDIDRNGVRRELMNVHEKLDSADKFGLAYWLYYRLSYRLTFTWEAHSHDSGMPHIKDPRTWAKWRESFLEQDARAYGKNLGGYVYCASN